MTNPYHAKLKPKNGADSIGPLQNDNRKVRVSASIGSGNIRERSIGTMR